LADYVRPWKQSVLVWQLEAMAMLPVDGTWRGWQAPRQPGDFAYANKLPWFRIHPGFSRKDGPLTITGERLDGAAPRFTETAAISGYGMIMGGIAFPGFGCWQVTGRYKARN
jgi:hypothetical protein